MRNNSLVGIKLKTDVYFALSTNFELHNMPYKDNMKRKLTIGIDFGTDSCRALVVDALNGEEIAVSESSYKRWKKGLYSKPNESQYRHHPNDYIDSLKEAVHNVIAELPPELVNDIAAIGIDTTASTIAITDVNGQPLALLPEYSENPNAMFVLWKDHTAILEANEINSLSKSWHVDYTSLSGGNYSLEWFWAKILHLIRNDNTIRNAGYAAIELCDWIPALLTGMLNPEEVKRSRCAAGHKCLWAEKWGGYPSEDFLSKLDPQLSMFRKHLSDQTYTNEKNIGTLTNEWAEEWGLSNDIVISTGMVDAHAAAIGAGVKPETMVKIVGTSTCDIIVVPPHLLIDKDIPGISGQVDGSVVPGLIGIESGQAAFGDIYAWFRNLLGWTLDGDIIPKDTKDQIMGKILEKLTEEAKDIPIDDSSLVSLDWLHGRRSPYSDPTKKGVISGITLATSAPDIFKSLVESTTFGAKAIFEHYKKEGLNIADIVCVGGIPKKSPFVMQILSDVLGVPINVATTEQAGALGAATCAATAAGFYKTLEEAQSKMSSKISNTYYPNKENHICYNALYEKYLQLGTIN